MNIFSPPTNINKKQKKEIGNLKNHTIAHCFREIMLGAVWISTLDI